MDRVRIWIYAAGPFEVDLLANRIGFGILDFIWSAIRNNLDHTVREAYLSVQIQCLVLFVHAPGIWTMCL